MFYQRPRDPLVTIELLTRAALARPSYRGGVVQGLVLWKSWPGVRSSKHAQMCLASIYKHECGVGFRACSFAPPPPNPPTCFRCDARLASGRDRFLRAMLRLHRHGRRP
jgi:hypothetical protein